MQAPFHSPLLAMFQQDNGTMAAPLADGYGLRRRPVAGNQRFAGMFPNQQPMGGYDSSGINPGGGALPQWQHPMQQQFPHNPGGFHPMSLAGLFRQYA